MEVPMTEDNKKSQNPMKELHDTILAAVLKFEDENPAVRVTKIELKRDTPGSRTLQVLVHAMPAPR